MSEENIESITKSGSNFAPTFIGHHVLLDIKKNEKLLRLYISYIINKWARDLNTDLALGNCLFASVKLTKNDNHGKYKNTGYDIKFDSRSEFVFTDENMEKYVIWSWYELICAYW